jgi:hypothetical protein
MSLTSFRLLLDGSGRGAVIEVGGVDISQLAGALSLTAMPGSPPRLVVEMVGDADVVAGLGEVTLIQAGATIVDFLTHIDADELEAEALGRLDGFEDATATKKILDVLAEWAAGA